MKLPISNPKPDLHNIIAHTKISWKSIDIYWLSSENENINMSRADNCKNLSISNPKSDLQNIYAHTKSGENAFIFTQVIIWKILTDRHTTDGHMDSQGETIIPCHYHITLPLSCGRALKNVKTHFILALKAPLKIVADDILEYVLFLFLKENKNCDFIWNIW